MHSNSFLSLNLSQIQYPLRITSPVVFSKPTHLKRFEKNLPVTNYLSEWFASSKEYGSFLHEDDKIRSYVTRFFEGYRSLKFSVGSVSVIRTHGRIFVSFLYCSSPEKLEESDDRSNLDSLKANNNLFSTLFQKQNAPIEVHNQIRTQYSYSSFVVNRTLVQNNDFNYKICESPSELKQLAFRWRLHSVLQKELETAATDYVSHRAKFSHLELPSTGFWQQQGLLPPGWQFFNFDKKRQNTFNSGDIAANKKSKKKVRRSHAIGLRRSWYRSKPQLFHFLQTTSRENKQLTTYAIWRRLVKWHYKHTSTFNNSLTLKSNALFTGDSSNFFQTNIPVFRTVKAFHFWWHQLKLDLRSVYSIKANDTIQNTLVEEIFKFKTLLSTSSDQSQQHLELFRHLNLTPYFSALKKRQYLSVSFSSCLNNQKVILRKTFIKVGKSHRWQLIPLLKSSLRSSLASFYGPWMRFVSKAKPLPTVGFFSSSCDHMDLLHRYLEYLTGCQIFLNYTDISSMLKHPSFLCHYPGSKHMSKLLVTDKQIRRFSRQPYFNSLFNTGSVVFALQRIDSFLFLKLIVSWFKRRPRSQSTLFRFLTVFFNSLIQAYADSTGLQGIKLVVRGRLAKSPRKKKRVFSVGRMPLKTYEARIQESRLICRTKRGIFSFRLFVYLGTQVSSVLSKRRQKRLELENRELEDFQRLGSLYQDYASLNPFWQRVFGKPVKLRRLIELNQNLISK